MTKFGLTASQYQTELESAVAAGFRLTNVESYLRGGQVRYAFTATKDAGPAYRAYHSVTAAQHEALVEQLAKGQSMAPVAVSVVAPGGVPTYTALWEKRSVGGWTLRSNIPASAYQGWVTAEASAGRKLAYVDAYVRGRATTFSAITTSRSTLRLARHGLTGQELQKEFEPR